MSEPAKSRLRRRLDNRINSTYDLIKRVPMAWWAALGRQGIGLAWSRGYPDRRVPALPTAAPPPGAPGPRRAGRVALGVGGRLHPDRRAGRRRFPRNPEKTHPSPATAGEGLGVKVIVATRCPRHSALPRAAPAAPLSILLPSE